MKRFALCLAVVSLGYVSNGQGLKGVIKKAAGADSSGVASRIIGRDAKDSLTTNDVVSGLKAALETGTTRSVQQLSSVDGYFKDAAIKILMPEEAKKVETTLRRMGMGRQVDDAILSMNRAAEDAAKDAAPIFVNAIRGITIQDAWGILRGGDSAATRYLRGTTTAALTEAFRPVIENSLGKTGATRHWNTVFTNYNRVSSDKVNTDLVAYVTERALAGLFYQVALEEMKIRRDPAARSSDILRKVFGR